MYGPVPSTIPTSVSGAAVIACVVSLSEGRSGARLARPKSSTITRPCFVIITLAGFKSRCTIPA